MHIIAFKLVVFIFPSMLSFNHNIHIIVQLPKYLKSFLRKQTFFRYEMNVYIMLPLIKIYKFIEIAYKYS